MKKVLISILTLIFIVSMITTVYAATEGNISVAASADTVVKGKTFTVTVTGTAEANIKAMEAKLTYDTSKLTIESKSAGAGFSDLSGSNEIAISATSSENLSKEGTLYTITFKVLDNATEGGTTISVTNAVLALLDAENTKESNDEVTVTIKADDTTVDNQGGTTTEEPENTVKTPSNTTNGDNSNASANNGGKEENKNVNKNTTKNTSKNKTTKLPQTGAESISVIAIILLGVVTISSYISYRKYKNI